MQQKLDYRSAGVDIDAGHTLVERIKPHIQRTHRPGVVGGLGGFAGLFEIPLQRYRRPLLVSGTDGVGTKLKLALQLDRLDTIGIDLVAMCVNDILVTGAEPLFFLDYYASGRLNVEAASRVIASIARGCEIANTALIGGETAEMPGVYQQDDFDLAGFCVGIVEKDQLIDGRRVRPGDKLIGLASSGPHANGFSLIRKIIDRRQPDSEQMAALLEPTRIYVDALHSLMQSVDIKALAHITGGGITENLPRTLPTGTRAIVDTHTWRRQAIFDWLQSEGGLDDDEMWRTFNCGIGMVICVSAGEAAKTLHQLNLNGNEINGNEINSGESAWLIGEVQSASGDAESRIELNA